MKRSAFTVVAGLALAGISFGVVACTQAPVAAAPADTSAAAAAPAPPVVVEERHPVVVEQRRPVVVENHPRPGVDINVHKRDDGDHASVDIHARP